MNLLAITSQTWEIAGISVGIVFSILALLVLLLYVFSWLNSIHTIELSHRKMEIPDAPKKPLAAGKPADEAENENLAAVAVAVHLYLSHAHDDESGVLTIKPNAAAGWHAVLNPRF